MPTAAFDSVDEPQMCHTSSTMCLSNLLLPSFKPFALIFDGMRPEPETNGTTLRFPPASLDGRVQHKYKDYCKHESDDDRAMPSASWTSTASESGSSPVSTCFQPPVQASAISILPSFSVSFPDDSNEDDEVSHTDVRHTSPADDRRSSPLSSLDEDYGRCSKRPSDARCVHVVQNAQRKRRRIVARLNPRPQPKSHSDVFTVCKASVKLAATDIPPLVPDSTALRKANEEEGVACILLSLGSDPYHIHEQRTEPTERAQRAVRRNYQTVTAGGGEERRFRKYMPREQKATMSREPQDTITPYLPGGNGCLAPPSSERDAIKRYGVREFPQDLPKLVEEFPMWYRRFHVPTPMNMEARKAIFGVSDRVDASCIASDSIRAAFLRSCREFAIWKEPDHLLDLYTPRWMRSVGREKEALCTVCYEEGMTRFLKTKTSQYNYHLINQHGISPLTRRPFDPPNAFRIVLVSKAGQHERQQMLQGHCHVCLRYVDLQSVRDGQVNVPEIYWWKHASQCHKRDGTPCDFDHIFIQDEIYRRTVDYIGARAMSNGSANKVEEICH